MILVAAVSGRNVTSKPEQQYLVLLAIKIFSLCVN